MLLGKRPRPPVMRRTRSMSGGLSVDMQTPDNKPNNLEPHHEEQQSSVMMSDRHNPLHPHPNHDDPHAVVMMGTETPAELTVTDECLVESRVMFPSHTTTITNNNIPLSVSAPIIHSTPHFLRTCGLCNCRLAPGRDIYMYRYLIILLIYIYNFLILSVDIIHVKEISHIRIRIVKKSYISCEMTRTFLYK
jgi:hypothetical protein